jgi:methionyl-tRNA formyltransferase
MNIFLLTQPDAFYIPKLIDRFVEEAPEPVRFVGAAALQGEIAAHNVPDYLRLLGVRGTVLMGMEFARYKFLDALDAVVGLEDVYSVSGVLRKHDIPEDTPENVNDPAFLDDLRTKNVDLVISIACPQIIREELRDLPPHGVINVHGALLPEYRGKLPSFWVLANGETTTGVTVHYVNEGLDDGPIIVQERVPIKQEDTLHSLVLRSKVQFGATALAAAVRQMLDGTVSVQDNPAEDASYFSFPTREAIRDFRARGRRVR